LVLYLDSYHTLDALLDDLSSGGEGGYCSFVLWIIIPGLVFSVSYPLSYFFDSSRPLTSYFVFLRSGIGLVSLSSEWCPLLSWSYSYPLRSVGCCHVILVFCFYLLFREAFPMAVFIFLESHGMSLSLLFGGSVGALKARRIARGVGGSTLGV